MKLMDRLKKMDRTDRSVLILSIIIFILLVINGWFNIQHAHSFTERKLQGNARWEEVENRIMCYEHKIELLEKEIENLNLKIKGGQ